MAVHANVVPATLPPKEISVVAPEQIEFKTGTAVATGIALTSTTVVDVSGAPPAAVGVAVQI